MPKKNPAVSIIIPNFNHAQYIGDAIRSVLAQTYRDFEIIVIDDGSTDNSREVVAQFGEKVNYIWQENSGLSAARNTGIKIAAGTFVGLLDADDMYEPDFMSTLVPILEANPDAEAVYCGYQFVDHLNNPLPQKEARSIPTDQLYQALVDGNFLVPESILVRKRCYEQVGPFDVTLRACEDVDMWLRITSRYKVIGSTKLLTRHRILPNSMSTDPTRQTQNRLAVINKHFGPKPAIESEWTDAQRHAYAKAYLASAVEYLQAHKEARAYESFCEMVYASSALLADLNTFYELGCGEQPKGFRGDFDTLNIELNAGVLMKMLDQFFDESNLPVMVRDYKRGAYGNANFALGLLCYGSKQFKLTRKFLLDAIKYDGKLLINRRLAMTYIKSLLGVKMLAWLASGRRSKPLSQGM